MFKPARAYGDLNTYDALKLLALLTMVIDHLGAYLWQDMMWLRAIGRMAFPLFLFLVGYSARWQVRRDFVIWAGLIIVCAMLTHQAILPLNVLVTIALVRIVMVPVSQREMSNGFLCALFLASVIWFPLFFWTDYCTLGLLFAVCGYLQRIRPRSTTTLTFLYATLMLHYFKQYLDFRFNPANTGVMIVMMVISAVLMHTFRIERLNLRGGTKLQLALAWASRNTLALYGLHVMMLMVLERMIYPERLLEFKWM